MTHTADSPSGTFVFVKREGEDTRDAERVLESEGGTVHLVEDLQPLLHLRARDVDLMLLTPAVYAGPGLWGVMSAVFHSTLAHWPPAVIWGPARLPDEPQVADRLSGERAAQGLRIHARLHRARRALRLDAGTAADRDAVVEALAGACPERLRALARWIEVKHGQPGQGDRMERYVRLLARAAIERGIVEDVSPADPAQHLGRAVRLRDLGQLALSESLFQVGGSGRLTEDEQHRYRRHPRVGARLLQAVGRRHPEDLSLRYAPHVARGHHEHWNGRGFPDGLSGEDIPLSARLSTLAEVYDTLRFRGPRRVAISHPEAARIVREQAGSLFDPEVVALFGQVEDAMCQVAEDRRP